MKKHLLSIAVICACASPAMAAHQHPEKYYQKLWCDQHGGVTEYRLDDGTRVDCLTKDHAIEFDFAPKWAESIGQAIYYGLKTDSKPGVVLIMEESTDQRYLDRLNKVATHQGITVWTMEPEDQ